MARIKVLLVDDEKDFLDVMQPRIESWGYETIVAQGGKEALSLMPGAKPNIIILDYLMPELDGIDTLRLIRKIDKGMPVIMFTAHPDEKTIKGTEELGVNAFIPKLSTYSDVQASLRSALALAEHRVRFTNKEKEDNG